MNLYENIKKVAKEKGYTVNSLEKELGYARSYLSKFKTTDPGTSKTREIAEFLGVSTDYLITGGETSFDKFSQANAILISKVANDDRALRLMEYYLRLSKNGKEELEKMAELKVDLENKKE